MNLKTDIQSDRLKQLQADRLTHKTDILTERQTNVKTNRLRFWTDVIGIDLPEGIYHVRVAVQTEDLFLGPADGELAPVLNVLGVGEVQGSEAGFGQICQEDIPPH